MCGFLHYNHPQSFSKAMSKHCTSLFGKPLNSFACVGVSWLGSPVTSFLAFLFFGDMVKSDEQIKA
ncbi:hypothetical protein GIB67_007863, partial [Kingdonia uniflora]